VVWLLHHKLIQHEDSAYVHYIQSLPPHVLLPLVYNESETRLLHGSRAHELVAKQRTTVEAAFTRWVVPLTERHPSHFPAKMFIAQEFQWAVTILWSRAFTHEVDGKEVYNLVPLLDMANHRPWPLGQQERLHKDHKFLVRTPEGDRIIYASEDLKAGKELFNDYGVLTNEQLLLMYGFVPRINPDDAYELSLDVQHIPPQNLDLLIAMQVLRKGDSSIPFKLYEAGLAPGMLAMQRIAFMAADEFPHHREVLKGHSLGPQNELRVANKLLQQCNSAIGALGPEGEEAEELLKLEALRGAAAVHGRASLAVLRYRQQSRRVLLKNLEYLTDLAGLADGPKGEL